MSFLTILDRLITVTFAHDTEMWMLMVKASKCQKLQICKQLTHSLLSFVWHKRMKLALSSVKKVFDIKINDDFWNKWNVHGQLVITSVCWWNWCRKSPFFYLFISSHLLKRKVVWGSRQNKIKSIIHYLLNRW